MSRRLTRLGIIVCVALVLESTSGASPASAPGAFELLERVRQAYADLETYTDLGEIETTTGPAGHEHTTLRFFETAATAAGGFLWRTHGESEAGFEERVVWKDGAEVLVYSSLLQQYKPVSSLAAELAHGWGRGSYEALVVPLLLAGADDALADPSAAMVGGGGAEPCGDATCWVISLTLMAGTITCELRVDQQTLLIHQVEVSLDSTQAQLEPAGGMAARSPKALPVTIRVRHHPGTAVPQAFVPPAGSRRVAEWQRRTVEDDAPGGDLWPESAFEEEITVALLTVVARIVDSRGEPLRDLEADDLIVLVGKTEAPVLSLEYSSSQPQSEIPPIELAEARAAASAGRLVMAPEPTTQPGRLVVFFLQVDLEPSRIAGHLKILPDVERLLRALHPDDRVALVSFDSHLKLWQDFTRDREQTFEVLKRAISYGSPAARQSRGVSLLEHFDRRAAADAASPEKALQLTAEALTPLPGDKDMIYMGWGLGRYGAGGVRMTADYHPAVRALDAARTTVFVLDVSQADYHSLEVGLQNVAAHTGGTYDRTLHFASQAVKRLARTIGGHYLVTIDRTAAPAARGRLTMRLREKKGRVLFKPLTLG